uniref:Uncharacterized protein n=1 Tax=Setaria viridis TaxID=4556 RepID=A0A4U6TCP2_SETVI|nr:hypothetical protein SEVIR_8G071175v2 [Setaria viridis]
MVWHFGSWSPNTVAGRTCNSSPGAMTRLLD